MRAVKHDLAIEEHLFNCQSQSLNLPSTPKLIRLRQTRFLESVPKRKGTTYKANTTPSPEAMSNNNLPSIRTSTIVYASIGTLFTGALAYAFYFDYKRRNDVEFRRALKLEAKKQAKAAKEEQQGAKQRERQELRGLVDEANEEGYPENADDKEAFFMEEVGQGEKLCQSGMFHSRNRGMVG